MNKRGRVVPYQLGQSAALLLLLCGWAQARTLTIENWSVDVPEQCAALVSVQRVPAKPTYSAADVARLQQNPLATLRPDYPDMPAHVQFDLRACFPSTSPNATDPVLRISLVQDWLGIADPQQKPAEFMRENLRGLEQWLDQPEVYSAEHLPGLPFIHASPVIRYGEQRIEFAWGRGIRLVTQLQQMPFFLDGDELEYVFQALSTDGRYYVQLRVPMTLDALPDPVGLKQFDVELHVDDAASVQGRQRRASFRRRAEEFIRQYEAQLVPALAELDQMLSSIRRTAP